MYILRRYKKLSWWDLVEIIDQVKISEVQESELIELVDELRLRLLESVSEGGSFKVIKKANELKEVILQKKESPSKELISLFDDF